MKMIVVLILLGLIGCTVLQKRDDASSREPASVRKIDRRTRAAIRRLRKSVAQVSASRHAADDPAVGQPDTTLPNLFAKTFAPAEINACIESMCGPASQNWSSTIVGNRPGLDLMIERRWNKDYRARLASLAEQDVALNNAKRDRLKFLLANPEFKFTIPDFAAGYINFLKLNALIFPHLDELYAKFALTKDYDHDILGKLTATLNGAQGRAVTEILKRIYSPGIEEYVAEEAAANPLLARLLYKKSILNFEVAQKADATLLINDLALIRKKAPEFAASNFGARSERLLNRAADGAELNLADSAAYVAIAHAIFRFKNTMFDPDMRELLKAADVDLDAEYARFKTRANRAFAIGTAADIQKKVTEACLPALRNSLALNSSPLRNRKFNELVNRTVASSKRVYSASFQRQDFSFLDEIRFAPLEDNEQRWAFVSDTFADTEETLRTLATLAKGSPDYDQLLVATAMVKTLADDAADEGFANESDIAATCNHLPTSDLTDFSLSAREKGSTSRGRILLSWYSANYPEVGVAITAHEIGHLVEHHLDGIEPMPNTYSAVLNCVGNRNPYMSARKVFTNSDDEAWSNEDFADHFSSLVMNDLRASHELNFRDRNEICGMTDQNTTSYLETTTAPLKSFSHSSHVVRLVLGGVDQGQTTPQCRPFLDYAALNGRELNCGK